MSVTAVVYIAMLLYALVRPPTIANRLFLLSMLICAAWVGTYHQELVMLCRDGKLAWMRARFMVVPFLSVLWPMLMAELAGVRTRVPSWLWALCFLVPILTVPIAMTMGHHDLFRHGFRLAGVPAMRPLLFDRGPWCTVYDLHGLALQLWSLALNVKAARTACGPLRKPLWALFGASILPVVGNAAFNAFPNISGGLNPAILLLVPSCVALALAVFQSDILSIAPVAQGMLFDHIHDAIIVVDRLGRIADLNIAAARMFGVSAESVLLGPVNALPTHLMPVFDTEDADLRVFEDPRSPGRWFERVRHPVEREGKPQGWMFVLEDVTHRIAHERERIASARAEEEAKRVRQWQLLLRDLHDGIGGISANIAMLATLARRTSDFCAKDDILAQIAQLASEGNIEVRTMMNSLEARDMSWPDLFAEIRRFAALVLEPRGIRFTLKVEGKAGSPPGIANGTSLFRIVKETVINAAKHAGASVVHVLFVFCDGKTELTVSDDGHWKEGRPEGHGLHNLRQRIQEMGGEFRVETAPETRIVCTFSWSDP